MLILTGGEALLTVQTLILPIDTSLSAESNSTIVGDVWNYGKISIVSEATLHILGVYSSFSSSYVLHFVTGNFTQTYNGTLHVEVFAPSEPSLTASGFFEVHGIYIAFSLHMRCIDK